jgi:hypothetical protein
MGKKSADIVVRFTVTFEDDGDLALVDQAHEVAIEQLSNVKVWEADIEVVGAVRDADPR